ncbi:MULTISPECIES: ABC transporter ATP-binding protein [Kitasatospora]|uniref:Putative multidrug ABC transporter ATP-binding and permease protein n=1 Tax=Kitasatospora setae (strain ATCC 33774 / DSM 43861 / JCM 3304 / KCC A-0304 / NBRC 14216 / KM-6054) TaxID=452652 RepID=E4NH69_KITSK|nr:MULTISPECIES: ABC transporter ATP-binding protein [Kitasatospora]BAJ30849.1 putative multidrug ABC transporter ATP-binding and permease protein [Kitasatospora setae KM-6054]
MSTLPIATTRQVRRAATALVRADGRAFAVVLGLNAAAALLGLAGPWLLGRIIDRVADGATAADIDRLGLLLLGCALVQILTSRQASYLAHRFGERAAAKVREQLLDRVFALPAGTAERAGAGDLTSRGTADATAVGETLRDAAPHLLIAGAQALFLLGAVLAVSPLLGACGLVGIVGIVLGSRWYLRRSRPAYLADRGATAGLAETLSATAHGARTVDALGLREQRLAAGREAVGAAHRARTRTLYLRLRFFAVINASYAVPTVLVLPVAAVLVAGHTVSLGAAVSAALYLHRLADPLDTIVILLEGLQSSTAAYARVEGLAPAGAGLPAQARTGADEPADDRIRVTGVRYAYPDGPDVLHGLDLDLTPGERLAVVGPSGSGKTTLGRLLAGVDRPRTGGVTVGGVPLADLSPERLRRQVVLVTQEHHVFLGTLRDNLRMAAPAADDTALTAALDAVGWQHDELPAGLDTELGPTATRLDGARAQQLALARVILADPHTLVLDEATALLDPATARHTERALAAALTGRTVIAIAHRLHTAHDADRVAVLTHGRLTDLGPHEDLLAAGGPYADLWHTWRTT